MKCQPLVEGGFLSSVLDFVRDGKFPGIGKKDISRNQPYLKGSISTYSKDLIMTFPNMCDNSLPPSTASMLSRANERNIVTMLQLLLASTQLSGTDGVEVLSKVHKNIKTSMSAEDYIDFFDNMSGSLAGFASAHENAQFDRIMREMTKELKTPQKSFPVNSFSENSINDFIVHDMNGKTVVKEYISDIDIARIDSKYLDDFNKRQGMEYRNHQMANNDRIYNQKQAQFNHQMANDNRNYILNQRKFNYQKGKDADDYKFRKHAQNLDDRRDARDAEMHDLRMAQMQRQNVNMDADIFHKQLLDSDVKKANELQPSLIVVRYNELDSDGTIYDQRPFVAGVKSRLISVDAIDIVERLVSKNKTKLSFLNLIRATTGEINFIKDFLLCIDQAKIKAKNSIKRGPAAKMWDVLEYRSTKNNFNRTRRSGNDASAITTLTINQETVNIMKKEYDFDIENINNAKMILDAYNLMGIIIADESIDVAKFFYAGNDSWEQQAYSFLQKESNDNSYKKVINLLNKRG